VILSDDFIAELKEKNDISEIISQYVDIQRKGRNMMGLCPFHAERTPSFCVYPASGSFYCFGCGAGGDVITFLRLIEHYDYLEAVKSLCERCGMNFSVSDEENELHKKKLLIYEINRESARFYYKCLLSEKGKKARDYLKNRGINSSTITHFGLGYSPNNRFSLVDYLKKRGYNEKDIILSNLAFKSQNMRELDRFYDRLMFPIIDVRGNVIAFGARTLSGKQPKYINTSDTLVFKKSNNLFALNFAAKSSEKYIILAEGYMDVIALHQAGFTNAVATLGTSLTNSQVKMISRSCDEVILAYDSDSPGQKASQRAISLLKANGLKVKIISIPHFKDPDEFLRSAGENAPIKFEGLIKNSKNDLEYQLSSLKSKCDVNTSEGKVKYLTEGAKILANSASEVEREIYSMMISSEIGVRKSTVLIQVEKYIKQNSYKTKSKEMKNILKLTAAKSDEVNKQKQSNLRGALAEESLIACIINNRGLANTIISKVSSDLFVTEFNRKVFDSIKDIISKGNTPEISSLSCYEFSFKEIGRITKIMCSYDKSMGREECIAEYIKILEDENKKKKFQELSDISANEIKLYIENLKET